MRTRTLLSRLASVNQIFYLYLLLISLVVLSRSAQVAEAAPLPPAVTPTSPAPLPAAASPSTDKAPPHAEGEADTAASLYLLRCSGCHTVGGGALRGPAHVDHPRKQTSVISAPCAFSRSTKSG